MYKSLNIGKKITELHFKCVNCMECELHFNKAINVDLN